MRGAICILFSLIAFSCGVADFSSSGSIKVNPEKYNQVIGENEDIYVEFGYSPDHISAEAAFEIQDGNGRAAGSFEWQGNTMIFMPRDSFKPGRRYMLKYAGEVSDTSGKVHKYNIYTPFYYAIRQGTRPDISRMHPTDGSTMQPDDKVIFYFSAPMSQPSFLSRFSVLPETDYREEWNEDYTQLTLLPQNGWKEHQVYKFSFSKDIVSDEGIPLTEPRTFSLYSSSGAVLPSLIAIDTALNDGLSYPLLLSGLDGVKNRDAIRITFSEPMDAGATEGAISISPDIAGHTCWIDNCTLVFVPEAEWQGGTVYSVAVSTEAKSKRGLGLPEKFVADFSPDVNPLKLLYVEGKEEDAFPLAVFNPHHEVDIDTGDANLAENTYTFGFVFNKGFISAEEKEQIYSKIRLRGVFPPSLVSPKVMSIFWLGNSRIQITYTGFKPGGRIYLLDVEGLGKITLRTR